MKRKCAAVWNAQKFLLSCAKMFRRNHRELKCANTVKVFNKHYLLIYSMLLLHLKLISLKKSFTTIIFLKIIYNFINNDILKNFTAIYFSLHFNVAACKILRVNVMHLNNYRGNCLHFWHGKYRHYGSWNHLQIYNPSVNLTQFYLPIRDYATGEYSMRTNKFCNWQSSDFTSPTLDSIW